MYGDVHDPATLPTALAGCRAAYYLVHSLDSKDFEQSRRRGGPCVRPSRRRRRGAADHLPRRPRQRGRRALLAPAQPSRGRGSARGGGRPGHGAARRHHRRQRRHLVGDDPPARRPPAGDGHAPWVRTRTQPIAVADVVRYLVGSARRAAGRSARSSRSADPRCSSTSRCCAGWPGIKNRPLADRAGPAAHPRAVLALAGPGHRRGHPDRVGR